MTDNKFPNGFIVKPKHENAPDFIKLNISIKADEFIQYLKDNNKNGWLNMQIKESKGGKLYTELDTFEPTKKTQEIRKEIDEMLDRNTSEGYDGEIINADEIPF